MLVDSHCHLDRLHLDHYPEGLSQAIVEAKDNGVEHLLCVSIDLEAYPDMLKKIEFYENIWVSVGVHPNEKGRREPRAGELVTLAKHPKNVAIGETGLDYSYNKGDLSWQQERFRHHIRAALEADKPLIIHSRNAGEDTVRVLKEERAERVGGVMHCFTGTWEMAEAAIAMGFYISFSGIVTFNNAAALREVAARVPLDRLLVETDSPYLSPVPFRGKPNEPKRVALVAERIAEIRKMELIELHEATTDNFFRLFIAAG